MALPSYGKAILTYGAIVWAHKVTKNMKPLQRIQRLALLSLGHFPKSIPTKGLEIAANYTPLDLHIKEMAANTALRIKGRNKITWDGIGFNGRRGHLHHYIDNDFENIDYSMPTVDWNLNYELNYDSLTDGVPLMGNDINIFTDGSKIDDGPTGYLSLIHI